MILIIDFRFLWKTKENLVCAVNVASLHGIDTFACQKKYSIYPEIVFEMYEFCKVSTIFDHYKCCSRADQVQSFCRLWECQTVRLLSENAYDSCAFEALNELFRIRENTFPRISEEYTLGGCRIFEQVWAGTECCLIETKFSQEFELILWHLSKQRRLKKQDPHVNSIASHCRAQDRLMSIFNAWQQPWAIHSK